MDIQIEIAKIDNYLGAIDTMVEKVQTLESCRENSITIAKLEEANMWLRKRLTQLVASCQQYELDKKQHI